MLIFVIEDFCMVQGSIYYLIMNINYLLELDGFWRRYDYFNIKGNITEARFLLGEKSASML